MVETELYLDSNWQNHPVRAGFWVEGVNSSGDGYDSWGIIEFVTGSNYGPASNATTTTGFRIWDSVGSGGWDEITSIDLSGLWDTWVSLRVELNTDDGQYDYYIDDTLVGSFPWDTGEDITQTGDIIFNHYDYNHGSEEGTLESGYTIASYTAFWDDLTLRNGFDMIQPAVDAASDGDMIEVAAGNYDERVQVDKSISLIGNGAENTILTNNSNDEEVLFIGNNSSPTISGGMTIEGFTFDGSTNLTGNRHIVALRATSEGDPIIFQDNTINCTDITEDEGVGIEGYVGTVGENVHIKNNTVTGCDRYGMFFNALVNAEITGNTIEDSGVGGLEINTGNTDATHNILIDDNTITNSTLRDIPDCGLWCAALNLGSTVYDVTVSNNTISNSNAYALAFHDRGNTDLSDVTVTGNDFSTNAIQVTDALDVVNLDDILTNNTFDRAVVVSVNPIVVPTIFSSIQDAVEAASSGHTVEVHPGTYETTGQVLIDKELTIEGAGGTKPVISPDADVTGGDPSQAWFLAEASIDFTLNNVELNGNGHLIHYGIRSHGNTTIEGVDFMEIQGSASGSPYHGIAVSSFGGTVAGGGGSNSHGSGGAASHLIVNNSTFAQIGRIGMLAKGDASTAEITNNMYTGKGNGDFIDYMVDLGAGGQATITGNTISDNRGEASSDGSTSAGILVTTFHSGGTTATIDDNTIEDNTAGVAVGYDGSDGSDVTVQNNNFSGNEYGVTSTNPQVDARYNHWGDDSGPSGGELDPVSGVEANGLGDEVGANVRFHPWLGDSPVSVDLAITEQAGWRMMGAPVTGVTVADLAEQNLVQGITGLPFDGFDANVLLWDPEVGTGEFVEPANGTASLTPGTGFSGICGGQTHRIYLKVWNFL